MDSGRRRRGPGSADRGAGRPGAATSGTRLPALRPWVVQQGFATCPPGLEDVLAAELQGLGVAEPRPVHGGVPFPATWDGIARANLALRTALRVLVPLARGPAADADELYAFCRRIPWFQHVDPAGTLAVSAHTSLTPALTHAVYVAQVVKDAIVDQLRERHGRRPDVDLDSPDLAVVLHLHEGQATLSLDSSGRSLHRRGYREVQVRSPLSEALAAGIVLSTGWRGEGALVDPMCGSATLPIEAALLATHTAPGLIRPDFAFLRWPGCDRRAWERILGAARAEVRHAGLASIVGADRHPGALAIARRALAGSGMGGHVRLLQLDVREHEPRPAPAVVVVNPPYGERLGDEAELPELYRELGAFLRQRCPGATAYVLSGNPELTRHLGLKATGRRVLFNGPIECRLLRYVIRGEQG
ncbi:MAG: THUMP domain-containing protein [Myxococcota bacterium]|nr:THUMP domain-containing protein [Myxococcota bacterium]